MLNDKFWEEAPLEMEQHQLQCLYHSLDELLLVAREFGKQRKK